MYVCVRRRRRRRCFTQTLLLYRQTTMMMMMMMMMMGGGRLSFIFFEFFNPFLGFLNPNRDFFFLSLPPVFVLNVKEISLSSQTHKKDDDNLFASIRV